MVGRWIRRGVTALLLLAVVAGLAAWWWSRQVLPVTEGRVALAGLQGEVQIARDRHGIPTIRAAHLEDALFGLGVVHVQDRLWQMETHRRIGAGRLAEAFGEGALDTDRFLRVLGVRRAAEAQWAQASPASRRALEAYSAGVNAALGQLRARPPEFVLLGLTPEPWTPVDSLSWAIMMALDLGANWQTEAIRLRLAMRLGKDRIDQLLPPYPGDPVPATQDYAALYRSLKLDARADLGAGTGAEPAARQAAAGADGAPDGGFDALIGRLLARAPEAELDGVGSNSWVVAASRTTTGAPLLANDPHLRLSSPALWYFARLQAPGLDVGGATMPGLPAVVLGQNDAIAWGFTNTGPDVQDTYLERLHPDDPGRYQTPDGWATFETRQETIRVRGAPPVALTVRQTRHGPVISDAAVTGVAGEALGPQARPGHVLALRWTGLDADTDVVATSLAIMRARSVDEFVQATRAWVAPIQNMAVADRAGHIALVSPGRVPVRGPENDLQGLAPAPGWDARYDWQGFLPAEVLPQVRDPERGFIANANQKITPPGYPYLITHQWALPYRHQRIEQLIEARPRHGLAELRAIQADVTSLAAPRLLPALKAVASTHPLAAAARRQLEGFEGEMRADRAAPLIFWAWQRQLARLLLQDELGDDLFDRLLGQRGYFDTLDRLLAQPDPWWCDDKRTPATEGCAQLATAAFDAALDELKALQGDDPAAWRWGRTHQARSEHRPFSRIGPLAPWFETREPVGGDTFTVNVSRVVLKPDAATGEPYLNDHGPSLRALYDLADRGNSRVVHSTGQSGIPWSPHFRAFSARWREVQDLPLFPPDADLRQVLRLVPAAR